jgi:hypothetical protein
MCASSQPFFLTASFLKPHDPFMPVERFARMFHPADMTLPTSWGKVDLSTVPKFVADQIRLFTRSNGRIRLIGRAPGRRSRSQARLFDEETTVGADSSGDDAKLIKGSGRFRKILQELVATGRS